MTTRSLLAAILLVALSASVRAQQTPAPGSFERYRTGDYTTPDGRQALVIALEVLARRGWSIISVSAVVLPKNFTLSDGYVLTADTVVHDIVVRWPAATPSPVVTSTTAPASSPCTDYNPQTPALDPPFPGAVCHADGGWRAGA